MTSTWTKSSLGDVATLQRGFDLPYRLRKRGPFPVVTSSGLEDTHGTAAVKGPGVVTGRYGTIGNVFFVPGDFWPLNTTLYVKDFHGNDPLFISYLLKTIDFHTHSGKSGVPGVNRNDLHELPVLIPPTKQEQQAIAAALSDADAYVESLEQLIAKKRLVKQGAMQELLTGKRRLPGFTSPEGARQTEMGPVPIDWIDMSLLSLADSKKERFDDGDWIEAEFLTTDGVRFIQTGNIGLGAFIDKERKKFISETSYQKLKCKEVRPGDLLICRLADPAGRACEMPDLGESKVVTSVDVTIFRPLEDVADRRFLRHLLSTNAWFAAVNERCGGSTRTRIARGALGKITLPLPPTKVEQTAIADVLSDMDSELNVLQTKLDRARDIKQGMMQNLLTGRIRLV